MIASHPAKLCVTGFLGNQSHFKVRAILQGLIQFVWIWRQPTPKSKLWRVSWETNHNHQSVLGWRQPTPNSKLWRVLRETHQSSINTWLAPTPNSKLWRVLWDSKFWYLKELGISNSKYSHKRTTQNIGSIFIPRFPFMKRASCCSTTLPGNSLTISRRSQIQTQQMSKSNTLLSSSNWADFFRAVWIRQEKG